MDRVVAIQCGSCKQNVAAQVIGYVRDEDADWITEFMACPECNSPIVTGSALEYELRDDFAHIRTGPPTRLWPTPPATIHGAPDHITRSFDEAQRSLHVGIYSGAALLARRTLEMIATDLGATNYTLTGKLEQLVNNGHIDSRLNDWARMLKEVGDETAHSTKPTTRSDAEDVVAFCEALAEYVYTYRRRYDEFRARRTPPVSQSQPDTADTDAPATPDGPTPTP